MRSKHTIAARASSEEGLDGGQCLLIKMCVQLPGIGSSNKPQALDARLSLMQH